jgi:SAM-dependent methyltransferase
MSGGSMFQVDPQVYDRHVGRYTDELAGKLLAAAGVEQGQRVLDVGCGPGSVSRALADLVGADQVAAIDPSRAFVEACRARVPGADVRVGEAENLPWDDDTFDATLSQLVLNFMSDAPAAVAEMRRVVKPGGTIAAATWDYAEGMTFLRRFWDAARSLGPADRDEGSVMRYCTPSELDELWRQAGLSDVAAGELHTSAAYESFDETWQPLESGLGPSGAHVKELDPDSRAALKLRFHELLGSPSGPFTLTARAWYVTGRA